jgi:drug/metabolite transporter (DMT)-like permease
VIDTSVAAGLALAVLAACCYDGGYAMQAYEARRAPARHAMRLGLLGHLLRRPIWVGAIALALVGWGFQLLALARAPLTLVQPTLALGLILLLVLGATVLNERVGAREICAAGIVIASVAAIAWAAPAESERVSVDASLLVALGVLAALTVLPFVVAARAVPSVALLVIGAGAADGIAGFVSKLVAQDVSAGSWAAAAAWGAAAGLGVLLGLIGESTALQRAPATRVAPAVLVLQITIPVLLAPLVGGESWEDTPLGGAVLVAALCTISLGVVLLAGSQTVASVVAEPAGEEVSARAAPG